MRTCAFSPIVGTFGGDYHDCERWAVLDWERAGVVVGCDHFFFFAKPLTVNEMVEEDEVVRAYIEG